MLLQMSSSRCITTVIDIVTFDIILTFTLNEARATDNKITRSSDRTFKINNTTYQVRKQKYV